MEASAKVNLFNVEKDSDVLSKALQETIDALVKIGAISPKIKEERWVVAKVKKV